MQFRHLFTCALCGTPIEVTREFSENNADMLYCDKHLEEVIKVNRDERDRREVEKARERLKRVNESL